jgi:hypothetical protein
MNDGIIATNEAACALAASCCQNEKHPGGRPRKEIDWEVFEKLCSMQCTQVEMASVLKVHIDTLRDRAEEYYGDSYSNIYAKYSSPGKASLRSAQFRLAQKNATMAIWLGKIWLGQRDNDDKNNGNVTLQDIVNFVSELKKPSGSPESS